MTRRKIGRVLVTGNLGYVGSVLVPHLRSVFPDTELLGFDAAYFAHYLTAARRLPEAALNQQCFGDIRSFPTELLRGVDAVVNLAAISNDPMGKEFEEVTLGVNHRAGIELAEAAKAAGVRSFVFASSCSVYGFADDGPRDESSAVEPLTAYARSKVFSERDLASLASDKFRVSCLRFATACGWSERLRLDLVLNDFVAAAISVGAIQILSDGTPWRPLIEVRDMARAIEWAIERGETVDAPFIVVNAGSNDWNYQVRDLAAAVAAEFSGVDVDINKDAAPDRRSYQVDFTRFRDLAPQHQPRIGLGEAISRLKQGLRDMDFNDKYFRRSQLIRLRSLQSLVSSGRLNQQLRWLH